MYDRIFNPNQGFIAQPQAVYSREEKASAVIESVRKIHLAELLDGTVINKHNIGISIDIVADTLAHLDKELAVQIRECGMYTLIVGCSAATCEVQINGPFVYGHAYTMAFFTENFDYGIWLNVPAPSRGVPTMYETAQTPLHTLIDLFTTDDSRKNIGFGR